MRKHKYIIIALILVSLIMAQQSYRSVDQVVEEWGEFTSYQKDEMISFCDFLFNEGFYERCLLSTFQVLYKFPDDPLIPVLFYYVARCYEEMGNYKLALRYYNKILQSDDKTSIAYSAAQYRKLYVKLNADEIDELMKLTEGTDDPYLMTFRGYGYMKRLKWEDAKTAFIGAQESFDHSHYNKLMLPLYQAIENISLVPNHNKYMVFLSGMLLPGGGQFMLREWDKGQGVLSSVGLLALIATWGKVNAIVGSNRIVESEASSLPMYQNYGGNKVQSQANKNNKIPSTLNLKSNSLKYTIPPLIIGSGVFISSILNSFNDTQKKNKSVVEFFIQERINDISPERFLDFPEPSLVPFN